jgi:NADPH-dependent F420 reductase
VEIAIVAGTGPEGRGLGLRFAKSGHRVAIGSRSLERAVDCADRLRARLGGSGDIEGFRNADAAEQGDVVVATAPFEAQAAVYGSLDGHLRPRAIVVDTTSPLASALGGPAWQVVQPWAGSAAEQAATFLSDDVRLVAGFHTVASHLLDDIEGEIDGDVFLSGNDDDAKAIVGGLVEEIPRLRWADVGDLSTARLTESMTALLISVNREYGVRTAGLRLTGRDGWGGMRRPPRARA